MFEEVKFKNLVAGSLLVFESIDSLLLRILLRRINEFYSINLCEESIEESVIVNLNGVYQVNSSFDEAINLLKDLQGDKVTEFFTQLNCQDIILQKLSMFSHPTLQGLGESFSLFERELIDELISSGYLKLIKTSIHLGDQIKEIVFTQKGRVRLFKINYAREIKEFEELLIKNEMDYTLIPDFLMAQNFDNDVYTILNLDNLRIFCMVHNRNMMREKPKSKIIVFPELI